MSATAGNVREVACPPSSKITTLCSYHGFCYFWPSAGPPASSHSSLCFNVW